MSTKDRKDNDRLLEYLDGRMSDAAQKMLEEELNRSQELRERLDALEKVHAFLTAQAVAAPSAGFTQKVLRRLTFDPSSVHTRRNAFWLLVGIVVVTTLAATVMSLGDMGLRGTIDLTSVGLQNNLVRFTFPQIPVNGKWIFNGVIVLNTFIALIALERIFLRPRFQQ